MNKGKQIEQILVEILKEVRLRTYTPLGVYKVTWAGEVKGLPEYSHGYYVHVGNISNNKKPKVKNKSDFYFRYSFRLYSRTSDGSLELSIKFWQPSFGGYSVGSIKIFESTYAEGIDQFKDRMVEAINSSRIPIWAYPRSKSFIQDQSDKILSS